MIMFGHFIDKDCIEPCPLIDFHVTKNYSQGIADAVKELSDEALLTLLYVADGYYSDYLNSMIDLPQTNEENINKSGYLFLLTNRSLEEAKRRFPGKDFTNVRNQSQFTLPDDDKTFEINFRSFWNFWYRVPDGHKPLIPLIYRDFKINYDDYDEEICDSDWEEEEEEKERDDYEEEY